MEEEINKVLRELKIININIEFIKEHMVDVDMILTPNEEKRFDESLRELEKGETISLETIKRDRR